MARRTFDESGDYTIKPFDLDVRESLKSGNNRGLYLQELNLQQVVLTLQNQNLAVGLSQGKAFVKGYEIEK